MSKNTFLNFRDLQILELSDIMQQVLKNKIFKNLSELKILGIRLHSLIQIEAGAFIGIQRCQNLTISGSQIKDLDSKLFYNLTKVVNLDLSHNKINVLENDLFSSMTSLQVLDTRGNDIYILGRIFENNINLKLIYGDTFALCCVKPRQMSDDRCITPKFDLSNCENLIENNILRVSLWVIGIVAVFGNMSVLIYRIKDKRGLYQDTFSVLVGNLTVADTLISVYLISIGIIDVEFRGEYIWREYKWRNSKLCSVLGIISVLSSEVSVLTISFITIARYLAVKFPFKEHRITRKDAVSGSVIIWMISFFIALIPYFMFEKYYSASGVCVSLPLRKDKTDGWIYSFLIFVIFNFLIFLFIAIAQIPIVYHVKKISSIVEGSGKMKHIDVAKRLSLVVATDCFCWIPIGTMGREGLMAIFGYDMKRTIYAWTVVFVLPVNSAINPFLYTFIDLQLKCVSKIESKRCFYVITIIFEKKEEYEIGSNLHYR
ncbi:hypothetical protein KUTeg_022889 [Tegillarca granosa]|uniref:G-protein coupled receptors family 1 profile domain-containing protein n=1 Tax=Tegillarca granosa TaxID=220873 RepID=A0ABQ9E3S9_TEGGR|nr:hypothetical protein KUTeg_022889 [Tegillarca granosa]